MINVALASDHAYISHMAASITSILSNTRERVTIHVLDCGMSEEDICELQTMVKHFGGELVTYNLKDISKKMGFVPPKFQDSLGLYGRFFLPELCNELNKIIYLDCDTIVVGDMAEVWNYDIGNAYVGGVKDTVSFRHKRDIGMEGKDYINSGVLIMNLEAWRRDDVTKQNIEYIRMNAQKVSLPDQEAINVVCKDKICILPLRYNAMSPIFLMPYKNICGYLCGEEYYTKKEVLDARNNPLIYHFTGYPDVRPWQVKCNHPRKEVYIRYQQMSGLKEEKDTRALNRAQKRTLVKFRFFPYSLYKLLKRVI